MGLRDMLTRAESTQSYHFSEPDDARNRVVPIPVSLDQRVETLRDLIGLRVELQSEQARIAGETDRVEEQILTHQKALAQVMLDLGIPSPLATDPEHD